MKLPLPGRWYCLNRKEIVFPRSQADLLSIVQLNPPVDLGVESSEFIFPGLQTSLQPGGLVPGLLVDQIDGSLVKGHWIAGGEKPDIPHNGGIRMAVAITGRTHLGQEVEED